MVKPNQEQILEKIDTLPDVILEALFSVKTAEVLKKIFENNHLDEDKRMAALELIGLILMGFVHKEEFVEEFQKETGLAKQICENIYNSVNSQVFDPIKETLDQIYYEPIPPSPKFINAMDLEIPSAEQKEEQKQKETNLIDLSKKAVEQNLKDVAEQESLNQLNLKKQLEKKPEVPSVFSLNLKDLTSKQKPSFDVFEKKVPISEEVASFLKSTESNLPKKANLSSSENESKPIPPKPVFLHKEEEIAPIKKEVKDINLNIAPPQPKISEIKTPPPPPPKVNIEIGGLKPKIKKVNYFDIPAPPTPPKPTNPPAPTTLTNSSPSANLSNFSQSSPKPLPNLSNVIYKDLSSDNYNSVPTPPKPSQSFTPPAPPKPPQS